MLVTSCSEDLYEDATEINKVKTVNLQDLPFLEQNINQRRASFKSTSESAIDYFSLIETQDILLVEQVDGTKDYTFALKLPYQDTLTNLIAQEKNNTITYSLIKYTAQNQEAWLQGLESNNPFAIPVTVTQFGIDSKSNPLCIKLKGTCPSGLHDLSTIAGCDFKDLGSWTFNITYYVCDNGGGSTGSSSAGDSGGSTGSSSAGDSGGTGGSSPSDPNANNTSGGSSGTGTGPSTFPKPCKTCDFSGAGNGPCVLIKKLTNDFVFKTKLATLFQSAKVNNYESYSVISNDPTPNTQPGQEDAYDYIDSQGLPNQQGAIYTAFTNSLGVVHSHYVGLNSIFSPDDLQDLYNKMLHPDISDDFFIGVVTAEGTTYILQVQDRQAFINFGNKYLADNTKTRDFLEKIYKRKYNLDSANKTENEKNFLKMMNDLGMGTSLAGTNFLPTTTPSYNLFNNLEIKTIDPASQNVKNTNCN